MRAGDLDTEIRIVRPGALERQGRSRVPGDDEVLVASVLARYVPAIGNERFASEQTVANAPALFVVRLEPDLAEVGNDCVIVLLEDGTEKERFDIKSVRPWPQDPRHALEISAVADTAS